MAITNHDRVGKSLELLKSGLGPFVQREITSTYKDRATTEISSFMGEDRRNTKKPIEKWDVSALLKLMWESWNSVFRKTLGRELSLLCAIEVSKSSRHHIAVLKLCGVGKRFKQPTTHDFESLFGTGRTP